MPFEGSFEDRLALRDVLDAYADAVNRADSDAWAATWDERGPWSLPGFGIIEGKAKIVDAWNAAMRAFPDIVFRAWPGSIEVRGETAVVRSYTEEIVRRDAALHRTLGIYDDICCRSDGGWLFTERRFQPLPQLSGRRDAVMKVLIQAVIDVDPETRGDALAGSRGWIEGALAQTGCLAYAWTLDPHVSTRIHVFEEWDSEEALAAHLDGPQYRGMLGHVGAFGVRASSSRKFAVLREGPVYNSHGVASAAFD